MKKPHESRSKTSSHINPPKSTKQEISGFLYAIGSVYICFVKYPIDIPPKNKQNKQVNLRDVGLSCDFSQEETQALLAAEVNSRHVGRDYT